MWRKNYEKNNVEINFHSGSRSLMMTYMGLVEGVPALGSELGTS